MGTYWFFNFFENTILERKIKAVAAKLLFQLLVNVLTVIWNLLIKSYLKFVTFTFIHQNYGNIFINIKKKIEKIHRDSEKLINSFKMKKRITWLFIGKLLFFTNFLTTALLLFCKINVFDIFNMVNFFLDFYYITKYWNSHQI